MTEEMQAGELELRKTFEETSTRNITSMLEHGNETRRLLRELEAKVERLEGDLRSANEDRKNIKLQLSRVQMKLYSGGTE